MSWQIQFLLNAGWMRSRTDLVFKPSSLCNKSIFEMFCSIPRDVFFWYLRTHLRLWPNWPTLLTKHYCLGPKSATILLSLTNDPETNKSVWQAMYAIFAKA